MAINPITTSIAREVFHTSLAGVVTKGVGSGYRIWDDRNAPWTVKKNTIQRESATLAMVSVFTAAIDWIGHFFSKQMMVTPALKGLLEKAARHQTVLKAVPISLGIFGAEALSRKAAPRNIWDKNGQLNESIIKPDDDDDETEVIKQASKLSTEQSETISEKKRDSHHRIKHQPLTFAQTSPFQTQAAIPASPNSSFGATITPNPFLASTFSMPPLSGWPTLGPTARFQV